MTGRFLLLLLSHTSPREEPWRGAGGVADQDPGPAGSSTEALATHRGGGGNGAVNQRSMSAFLMASTGHGEGLNRGGTGYRLRHMEGETERERDFKGLAHAFVPCQQVRNLQARSAGRPLR